MFLLCPKRSERQEEEMRLAGMPSSLESWLRWHRMLGFPHGRGSLANFLIQSPSLYPPSDSVLIPLLCSFNSIHLLIKLYLSCRTMDQALEILWGARQTGFVLTAHIIQWERQALHGLGDSHLITTGMSVMKEGITSCYRAGKATCVGSCGLPRTRQLR